jgi:hypothetical protein
MSVIIRMSVVLPAPLGPSRGEDLARGHVERDVVHDRPAVVDLANAADLEHADLGAGAGRAARADRDGDRG